MRRAAVVLLVLGVGCGGSEKGRAGKPAGGFTLHVRSELATSDTAGRADQFWRLGSRDAQGIVLEGSPVRMVETKHPVVMPPRIEIPKQKRFRIPAVTAARWKQLVAAVEKNPGSTAAWAGLLAVTGARVSDPKLRAVWGELSARMKVSRRPGDVKLTSGAEILEVHGAIDVTVEPNRAAAAWGDKPVRGHLRFRVRIHRERPIETRGWFVLDLRKPRDRLALTLSWCTERQRTASYAVGCFLPDQPTLAPRHRKKRDVAKSYVGKACKPRVEALRTTWRRFPFEPFVAPAKYDLVRSSDGSAPAIRSEIALYILGDRLRTVTGEERIQEELQAHRRVKAMQRSKHVGPLTITIQVPARGRIGGALEQLVAVRAAGERVVLIVEDTRPQRTDLAPPNATPWVKQTVAALPTVPRDKKFPLLGQLGQSVGLCEPLIRFFGVAADGRSPDARQTMFDRELPAGILACRCQGMDVDGIDAFRRAISLNDYRRRFRFLELPLSRAAAAPALVVDAGISGPAFVERVAKLTPTERKGVRLVVRKP